MIIDQSSKVRGGRGEVVDERDMRTGEDVSECVRAT